MPDNHACIADARQLCARSIGIIQRCPLAAVVDEAVGKRGTCGTGKIRTYYRALIIGAVNVGRQGIRIVEIDDGAIAPAFETVTSLV